MFKKINQRIGESSDWILNSKESLVILTIMASSIGGLFFAVFAYIFVMNKNWFLVALFGIMSFSSFKMLYKISKMVKKVGVQQALGGITANEFVWKKNKYGGATDGNSGHEGDEVCDEQDADGNRKIGKEVRDIYCKPK